MTSTPLRVGIAGLGTVGMGVLKVLINNKNLINTRAGREIVVTAVSARDKAKDRGATLESITWHDDPIALGSDRNVDVVVELIGGTERVPLELVRSAISNGKCVVTANKALIAVYGVELAVLAEKNQVSLSYEGAVAGGIPIIKALREGLAGNKINSVVGILNGTSNYILSAMAETGRDFEEILNEAQELGYAESNPSFDIDGIDAAHKLAILASVAFGTKIDFNNVYTEGIRFLSPIDFGFAKTLGYGIKLLGVAKRRDGGIEQRVHPCMVPLGVPINHVTGVLNGIVVDGEGVDATIFEGCGAGEGPTASAVVADLIDVARGNFMPTFGVISKNLKLPNTVPMADHIGPYYIRLMVVDEPGVFASVANSLKLHNVSMESILQPSRDPGESVPVVMTVHETTERAMQKCLTQISRVKAIVEPPIMIRIETLSSRKI